MDNFRLFRASVKAQGLQMLCVELTFGDPSVPFQLRADDCDILLQRRTAARITPQHRTTASRRTPRARARAASRPPLILPLAPHPHPRHPDPDRHTPSSPRPLASPRGRP